MESQGKSKTFILKPKFLWLKNSQTENGFMLLRGGGLNTPLTG